jgi:8-oxo-dGTP pyrophosphatase MutT (NUDIX family)
MTDGARPVFETPWFTVVAQTLKDGQPYYMLELPDYVSVIAVTTDGRMILVRQFRPVAARHTIELPSGHVDPGESPEEAGRRELLEETGYVAGEMQLLGTLIPDVGRLANRMWCYFAPDVAPSAGPVTREEGVTVLELSQADALAHAADGRIDHALNLAPLFLAVAQRKLQLL